jgi:hypothetical protein
MDCRITQRMLTVGHAHPDIILRWYDVITRLHETSVDVDGKIIRTSIKLADALSAEKPLNELDKLTLLSV